MPFAAGGMQVRCFAPGQGQAALTLLRDRLHEEQGDAGCLDDEALTRSATMIVVFDRDQAVAALCIHAPDAPRLSRGMGALLQLERFADSWSPKHLLIGSSLVVLADHRNRQVIDLLLCQTYRIARAAGVRFALLTCTTRLQALLAFYGFREYLPPAILDDGSAVLRMAMVCEDHAGFHASGSPLAALVQRPDVGHAGHAWLAAAFPLLG